MTSPHPSVFRITGPLALYSSKEVSADTELAAGGVRARVAFAEGGAISCADFAALERGRIFDLSEFCRWYSLSRLCASMVLARAVNAGIVRRVGTRFVVAAK